MENAMDAALEHAKSRAMYLNKCSSTYIIHISIKELGLPSSMEGAFFAKKTVGLLCQNPRKKLKKEAYTAVGLLSEPFASDEHVEQSIRKVIQEAWGHRDDEIWKCYFPVGKVGREECPSNRDFLMAIVDFVEMWKGFCEEVNNGK